jgi:heterokaryon incompatibility protein (HET)
MIIMSTPRSFLSGLRHEVKEFGKLAIWATNAGIRTYRSERDGICLLCNNLQPFRHQDSSDRTAAGWTQRLENPDEYFPGVTVGPGEGVSLLLENVSLKELLGVREKDEQTQQPKRDCRFCRFLCDIFDAFFADEYMNWVTEVYNGMSIKFSLMIQDGRPLIINCINFTWESNSISQHRVDMEVYLYRNFGQTSHGVAELPCLGPALHRSEDTKSQGSISFIREALHQCCTEHQRCAKSPSGFRPTRLIYLGTNDTEIQLQETSTITAALQWTSLSHCWGKSQPFKLLRDNIDALKQSINFNDLPPTFKDAVTVCRQLGIQYLWIDSLCIIQGDEDDWNVEASRMGDVYGQAFLVICAASSPNCHTPFLGPREEEWLPKQISFEALDGHIPINVRRRSVLAAPFGQGPYDPPFTSSWASRRRAGPLYTRGWCFQETFLASRVLHFGPGAITFECQTHCRSEDQLPPYPITIPGSLGVIDDASKWHTIVKLYTQRTLTFAKDKLPAIGGAASILPQAQRSTYIAGLWAESLFLDLLWQVMPVQGEEVITYTADEQKAPSWSWASVNLGVVWSPLKNPQWLAEVINVNAPPESTNKYGAVSGGNLSIRGRIVACLMTCDYQRKEHWVQCHQKNGTLSPKKHFRTDGVLITQTFPDVAGQFVRRGRAEGGGTEWKLNGVALFLCFAKTDNYNHVGMILGRSSENLGVFQRVGIAANLPIEWYESGDEMTVSIA